MTERSDYQATQPKGRIITDPKVRAWIYGIAMALLPLAVLYGIIDENAAPLWGALVASALVPALAVVNTPTGRGGFTNGM